MIRILHVSDTHGGTLPSIDGLEFDLIVHSGDFLPTYGRRMGERIYPRRERVHQARWLWNEGEKIAEWTQGKPFLLCPGNHDFYETEKVEEALWACGADAYSLDSDSFHDHGLRLHGCRWVPQYEGEWCGELRAEVMQRAVREIPYNVDILVAHCPPYGVLDMASGQRIGNVQLAEEMKRRIRKPMAILCGHVHESFGITEWNGIVVSNAATGVRIVEVRT